MKTRLVFLFIGLMTFQVASLAQSPKPVAETQPPNPELPHIATDPREFMNPDWMRMMTKGLAGDYLTGNVAVAGGALPWDPIPVKVTCDGMIRYTTNTDPKGNFLIAPGKSAGSAKSKADRKPFAAQFLGCAVEAIWPGFNANRLAIEKVNVQDSPNIGTITFHREEEYGGAALSGTSAAAPKEATKLFEKARNEWLANNPERARKDLQKTVEIYPQFAEAWYQLGKIQEKSKSSEAWNSFSKAVAADSKFTLPYEHLALLTAQAEKWQELVDVTSRELELNPSGTADVWYYNALGNYHLRKLDAAEASAEKSLAMDPLHVQLNTEQLLAVALAEKQNFTDALEHLRNCLTYFPPGPNLDVVKQQIAQIETAVRSPK